VHNQSAVHAQRLPFLSVAVAGSAIKWLRDSMAMIATAADVNTLAAQVQDTGGVYFVTAFSGLLAPYWDPGAAGLLIGITLFNGSLLSDIIPHKVYPSTPTPATSPVLRLRPMPSKLVQSSRA
jgi:sugar (pentulose or hexulose) kinase